VGYGALALGLLDAQVGVGLGSLERVVNGSLVPNKSIDTDVLSAGFARLLAAGHFRRYASTRAVN
jgi:hypothetical protein